MVERISFTIIIIDLALYHLLLYIQTKAGFRKGMQNMWNMMKTVAEHAKVSLPSALPPSLSFPFSSALLLPLFLIPGPHTHEHKAGGTLKVR